jgi:uncharacterized glyoxalase superfamily protein PhnB
VKRSRAKPRGTAKRKKATFSPIPPGFRTVTPCLATGGAAKALESCRKALGAEELERNSPPDGKILNARIRIGDSYAMVSDGLPGSQKSPATAGTTTVNMHTFSKDVDSLWNGALAAGAKVAMPLETQFWGDRYGQLVDPFGHMWSLSMRAKMSREEMEAKQKAATAWSNPNACLAFVELLSDIATGRVGPRGVLDAPPHEGRREG